MFRIVSEALSLLTKAAPGFNGRATLYIESSLPCIFIKVTCGVARRLHAATMRLIYNKYCLFSHLNYGLFASYSYATVPPWAPITPWREGSLCSLTV